MPDAVGGASDAESARTAGREGTPRLREITRWPPPPIAMAEAARDESGSAPAAERHRASEADERRGCRGRDDPFNQDGTVGGAGGAGRRRP